MISVWMLYCAGASLLVTVSGAALEHLLALRRYPTRWIWAACIGATLLLTAAAGRGEPGGAVAGETRVSTANAISPEVARAPVVQSADRPSVLQSTLARADSVVLRAWLLASLALAAWTAVSVLRLHAQRRTWFARTVRGVPVLVSRRVGPATVGMFRHTIVLPEWILSTQDDRLDLVLEHEREHIRARDPRLLVLALAAVILAPWNPGLWWQVRRLRLAIEIDCDARVLRRRNDVRGYGALLLEVGQRAAGGALPVAALAQPRSFLERRIRAMLPVRHRRRHATAGFSAALFAAGVFGVAAMPAPARPEFRMADATRGAEPPRIHQEARVMAAEAPPRPARAISPGTRTPSLPAPAPVTRARPRPSTGAAEGGRPSPAEAAQDRQSARSASDRQPDLRRQMDEVHAAIRRAVQQYHPQLWTSGLGRNQYVWFLVDPAGRVERTGIADVEWERRGWTSTSLQRSIIEQVPGITIASSHHTVSLELASAGVTANAAWVTRR